MARALRYGNAQPAGGVRLASGSKVFAQSLSLKIDRGPLAFGLGLVKKHSSCPRAEILRIEGRATVALLGQASQQSGLI